MTFVRTLFLIAFALIALEANAVFSGFAYVTPETEADYPIEVCVDQSGTGPIEVSVQFEHGSKRGWLITTHHYLDRHSQEFRQILWDDSATDSPIESISRLQYDGETEITRVSVPRELFARSYLYFDFPRPVYDGGWYYSVDLSTFSGVDEDC